MSFDRKVLTVRNLATPVQSQPANPALTASLVFVMMGLAVLYTPTRTGTVKVRVKLILAQNTTADGASWQISHGTGAAPVNGAAVTGTQDGQPKTMTYLTGVLSIPLTAIAFIIGLVVGTQIWIDLALKAVTGGTATVTTINLIIEEI